ncbi:MAG: SAM-dependent methyltransferase [Burkholderiales bacterium]|jgi:trans-aconitate methyltransferase|nr:SAM-dependent methyltransferase [Burkholderiales bacterium]
MQNWNSKLYDTKHGFVTEYGKDILQLLEPKAGELILDLGCGTGALTNEIALRNAKVIGIDSSESMISEAKKNYPSTQFICANGQDFNLGDSFDAVFSNAALHWMMEPQKVIHSVNKALKPGGRFVFEMGGKGNISNLLHVIDTSAKHFGVKNTKLLNYYPGIAEYSGLLDNGGFDVTYARLFSRPTVLDGKDGLRNWIKMFRGDLLKQVNLDKLEDFFLYAEDLAKLMLLKDGIWLADYVRLRMIAIKSEG